MKNLLAIAAALLSLAGGGSAETLRTVPATLDPAKAYVLVEYRLMENALASLPGSRRTMPLDTGLVLARYDVAAGDIRGLGRARASALPGKASPVEPFRNREIAKTETTRLMLLEVEPDTWVVQGWGSTSFSLGSYRFVAAPGTVTDLGVVSATPDWADGDRAVNGGDLVKMALLGPFAKKPRIAPLRATFRPRAAGDIPVPPPLAPATRPVAFTPGARFGNYLGGLVNRIEGVNASGRAPAP